MSESLLRKGRSGSPTAIRSRSKMQRTLWGKWRRCTKAGLSPSLPTNPALVDCLWRQRQDDNGRTRQRRQEACEGLRKEALNGPPNTLIAVPESLQVLPFDWRESQIKWQTAPDFSTSRRRKHPDNHNSSSHKLSCCGVIVLLDNIWPSPAISSLSSSFHASSREYLTEAKNEK